MRVFFSSVQPLMFTELVKSLSGRHSKGGGGLLFPTAMVIYTESRRHYFLNKKFMNKINDFFICMEIEPNTFRSRHTDSTK